MSVFTDARSIDDVERYAFGMSEDEVLDIFCTSKQELSQNDLDLFSRAYRRGRALGKAYAVDELRKQFSGRDGVKGILSYLVRTAEEWPDVEESTSKGNHTFTIQMP